jgi:hypothetical protein
VTFDFYIFALVEKIPLQWNILNIIAPNVETGSLRQEKQEQQEVF